MKVSEHFLLDQKLSDESLNRYAEFLDKKQEDSAVRNSFIRNRLEHDITQMVACSVLSVLKALYTQLDDEEKRDNETETSPEHRTNGEEARSSFRKCMKVLYLDEAIVGPLGERPLHVCALMAARFRGEPEKCGIQIAEGIVEGMEQFLRFEEGRWKHEVYSQYGKDYIAAVGSFIDNFAAKKTEFQDWENHLREGINSEALPKTLPMIEDLMQWYNQRLDRRPKSNNKRYRHIRCMVVKGLYEGETLLFPFIASGNVEAVRWLLRFQPEEPGGSG